MQSGWIEIFFLAMLAGFIGLRLYHVLGRRTGHERPVADSYHSAGPDVTRPNGDAHPEPEPVAPLELPDGLGADTRSGLEAIHKADRNFAVDLFLEGAEGAYRMVLESFWKGDLSGLTDFVSDEMLVDFQRAIDQRTADGETADNRIVAIHHARIASASLNGLMAEITVRFDSDILQVTRDAEGRITAGSAETPIAAHDLWTFSRHTASPDLSWLLIATDEAA